LQHELTHVSFASKLSHIDFSRELSHAGDTKRELTHVGDIFGSLGVGKSKIIWEKGNFRLH